MSLFKALLLSLLIYLFYRIFIFALKIRKVYKSAQKETFDHPEDHEGEVTITSNPSRDKKLDKDVGEYVNYEEVD